MWHVVMENKFGKGGLFTDGVGDGGHKTGKFLSTVVAFRFVQ